jgi:hypothetical protein
VISFSDTRINHKEPNEMSKYNGGPTTMLSEGSGEQLRHKHCRNKLHVEFLPYNLQICRQVPNERLNLSAASKMVFYQTS